MVKPVYEVIVQPLGLDQPTPEAGESTQGFFCSGGFGDLVLKPGETVEAPWHPIWWQDDRPVRNESDRTIRIGQVDGVLVIRTES